MKWVKKGFIFRAEGQSPYMISHTTPINAVLLDDCIRVYFSSRAEAINGNYVSYPCYVDVDIDNPQKVLNIHSEPLIVPGEAGMFDQNGVMIYKSVWFENKLYLYYGGWNRLGSPEAPYQVQLGLMISNDSGNTFYKPFDGPVMGLDIYDPLSIGNVYILIKGGIWYLFYTSYTKWLFNGKKATPEYEIKLAKSSDGINWEREGKVIISADEKGGVATPTVFEYNNKYVMLFGYRPGYLSGNVAGYTIGYAESGDLVNWNREDSKVGIYVSDDGWDSEMICYPNVINVNERTIMFYCGNGFGESGFGYAVLEED